MAQHIKSLWVAFRDDRVQCILRGEFIGMLDLIIHDQVREIASCAFHDSETELVQ